MQTTIPIGCACKEEGCKTGVVVLGGESKFPIEINCDFYDAYSCTKCYRAYWINGNPIRTIDGLPLFIQNGIVLVKEADGTMHSI